MEDEEKIEMRNPLAKLTRSEEQKPEICGSRWNFQSWEIKI